MSSSFEMNKYHATDDDEKVNQIVLVRYKIRFITKSQACYVLQSAIRNFS